MNSQPCIDFTAQLAYRAKCIALEHFNIGRTVAMDIVVMFILVLANAFFVWSEFALVESAR